MFLKSSSKAMSVPSTADILNVLITAGLSAVIVFVGNLSGLLPSLASDGGVTALIITGVIGPALVALKDWLTDYAANRS